MAIITCVALSWAAASPAVAGDDPCGTRGDLVGLVNGHGLVVLIAAGSSVAGADSVCAAIFGDGWKTDSGPRSWADETTRARAASGLDWLCGKLSSMPGGKLREALGAIDSWLLVESAVDLMETLAGAEAFATAVAFVPVVADLFPRDDVTRATMGRHVGDTLASGELNELEYKVADRLCQMPPADRNQCLRELWAETLKSGE